MSSESERFGGENQRFWLFHSLGNNDIGAGGYNGTRIGYTDAEKIRKPDPTAPLIGTRSTATKRSKIEEDMGEPGSSVHDLFAIMTMLLDSDISGLLLEYI